MGKHLMNCGSYCYGFTSIFKTYCVGEMASLPPITPAGKCGIIGGGELEEGFSVCCILYLAAVIVVFNQVKPLSFSLKSEPPLNGEK